MLDIQKWFPTSIGVADCPFIDEIQYDYQDILNNDIKSIVIVEIIIATEASSNTVNNIETIAIGIIYTGS